MVFMNSSRTEEFNFVDCLDPPTSLILGSPNLGIARGSTLSSCGQVPQMVLKLLQGFEDSEYVLSFEIGQRESGFYSERPDRITDTQTYRQSDRTIQYGISI